jgi:hypothetical protein
LVAFVALIFNLAKSSADNQIRKTVEAAKTYFQLMDLLTNASSLLQNLETKPKLKKSIDV